ncbi:MAG: TIGR01212 family radical SAM protein [Clostridiales bacterium]|nr:TIGR01212 family radical SAM protein [Clostridiales bacterium]
MLYKGANSYYREFFGKKVYKASVSLPVTCPNRDGSKGTGGCIFCSAGGSGEFAACSSASVTDQIDEAISRLSSKIKTEDTGFIAYFQSFTNTYIDPVVLRAALEEASRHPSVVGISLGTRPDCLPDDILAVLKESASKIPLYVELGLQTESDETAVLINRCYETKLFPEAVAKLKGIGVNVIAHVILYLPGEDKEQMKRSVKLVADCGCDGIKLTCLYVLEGTPLADIWRRGNLYLPDMEEYFDTVEELLGDLPDNITVHRITGDGPKKLLLAPMWTANKRQVINYINRRFGS